MRRFLPPIVFLALLGALSAGCTPHYKLEALRAEIEAMASQRPIRPHDSGYLDLKGVIHVHTAISHDSDGTVAEILAAAQSAGLDFVILTDHDSPRVFAESPDGWHQDVLFVRGMEITRGCKGSADRCRSLLAIDLDRYFDHRELSIPEMIAEIHRQDGLAFVAHPKGWEDWSIDGIDGMEIYDILDDVMDRKWKFPVYFFNILYSYHRYPREVFMKIQDRPDWHLARWDQLTRHRRIVGIAGNDAHRNVRFWGRQIDPYPLVFEFVTTHLLVKKRNREAILAALGAGHAYVAFDHLADPKGFWFATTGRPAEAIMGDAVSYRRGLSLVVSTPLVARMVLLKNGEAVERCDCTYFAHAVDGPGVYRVEVFLKVQDRSRLWILSNPIYVRE